MLDPIGENVKARTGGRKENTFDRGFPRRSLTENQNLLRVELEIKNVESDVKKTNQDAAGMSTRANNLNYRRQQCIGPHFRHF